MLYTWHGVRSGCENWQYTQTKLKHLNAYFVSFQKYVIGQGAKSEVEMVFSGPPDTFKSFKAYCEVMFAGPLKGKSGENNAIT